MPSTFSSLKIELIATGEQSGTWGNTTNTNLGTALEEAITGSADVTFTNGNDTTVTLTDTNAAQAARNLRLNLVGTSNAAQNLILGSGCQIEKLYLINNTLSHAITVKNTTGTGIAVPAGKKAILYNNGTNVLNAVDYFATADIAGGTINNTVIGGTTPAAGTFTQVNIPAQGDLRLEDTTGGEYVALQAPGTLASSYTLTLPVDDGTNGQALITDGNGVLSWSTAASGDVYGPASATDNAIARFDLTTGKLIQNSVVTIADTTGNMAGVGTISSGAITSSSLTSGRVLYAGTSGLIQDDADFTFNGTTVTMANDASISGLTVGKGGGAVVGNTVVGNTAGTANTTGANNTFIGQYSGGGVTTGSSNTFIGQQAGNGTTVTGDNNTGVGGNALQFINGTASANTALGRFALYSNTTASNNTAVGYQAGYSNTTGTLNVFVGNTAGYTNTTGGAITGVGSAALYSNTTGEGNAAFGRAVGYSNTTGARNAAFGGVADTNISTFQNNTTGSYNSAFGNGALASNTTASGNTAVGYQAGYSNTTANNNVAVGNSALRLNTTGFENAAFGYGALDANTTGYYNVSIGSLSSLLNTTGIQNVAVGWSALRSNTTGSYHTVMGSLALYSNTTGSFNTAYGREALYSNTTGTQNIGVGQSALYKTTTGSYNTAMGQQVLQENTTGNYNTAFGLQAGYGNTTGIGNVLYGSSAGWSNQAGNYNTFIGYNAGYNYNSSGNALNTAVGVDSGYNLTTGKNNTFLGYNAGNTVTTGSKNAILGSYNGNQDGLDIRTASNYAVISDGDGNRLLSTYNGGTLALDGGAVPQAGTGITFPATQSASSDANTLDDYEQGTWTPSFNVISGSATYTTQTGNYVKIGRQVTVTFYIRVNVSSSLVSSDIAGLPFTGSNTNYAGASFSAWNGAFNGYCTVLGLAAASTTTIQLRATGTANAAPVMIAANITNGTEIAGSLTYFVAD